MHVKMWTSWGWARPISATHKTKLQLGPQLDTPMLSSSKNAKKTWIFSRGLQINGKQKKDFKKYYYPIVFLSMKTQKYHRWQYQRIEKYCRIVFFLVIIIYDYSNFNRWNMGSDTWNKSKKKQKNIKDTKVMFW